MRSPRVTTSSPSARTSSKPSRSRENSGRANMSDLLRHFPEKVRHLTGDGIAVELVELEPEHQPIIAMKAPRIAGRELLLDLGRVADQRAFEKDALVRNLGGSA